MDNVTAKEQEAPAPPKPVTIEPGGSFTANGKTYFISDSFTIGRFEKVEELEEELMNFSDQKSCHQTMMNAMKDINDLNPGKAYMTLYNKIDSDQRNSKIINFSVRLCTAYINAEGEDTRYLTEDLMKQKISDWSAEGLDARPFLSFAVHVFKTLFDSYKQHILDILKTAVSLKEGVEKLYDIRSLTEKAGNG